MPLWQSAACSLTGNPCSHVHHSAGRAAASGLARGSELTPSWKHPSPQAWNIQYMPLGISCHPVSRTAGRQASIRRQGSEMMQFAGTRSPNQCQACPLWAQRPDSRMRLNRSAYIEVDAKAGQQAPQHNEGRKAWCHTSQNMTEPKSMLCKVLVVFQAGIMHIM